MANKSGAPRSYSVTSAGVNPVEDRVHRMRMYFIAMTLRLACVLSLFWLRGWWIVLPVVGAILLPWFAVMVGNAVAHGGEEAPETPDPLRIERGATAASDDSDEEVPMLVVDVEPVRRAQAAPPSAEPAEPAPAPAPPSPDPSESEDS